MTMKNIDLYGATVISLGMMFFSQGHNPSPSAAAVEIAPGAVAETDQKIMKELVAAFDQAEVAVQHADVDALMQFYEKAYDYHGLKRPDVQRVWTEVFSHYGHVLSRHVFTELKVVQGGLVKKAYVTCTGGLCYTEQRKSLENRSQSISWVSEVHYLAKEKEGWKFLGNVGGAPLSVPPTSAPHHPLF
jgi:hypothetical protein